MRQTHPWTIGHPPAVAVTACASVALFAVLAPVIRDDLGIQPLVIEAVMLSLLLLLAMQRAFAMIFAREASAGDGAAGN